ncbi:PLP-dependent aminotransferase family protein [Oleisolibacter albus]|uniref:aminotransferase-like domain-containing protein n=1 Tax=Oleisolibacter albus TaxID=2171757 RepID=UPI00139015F7|nr:PLP-dependent aminotransferase family protein [Oleisolibacter albus]
MNSPPPLSWRPDLSQRRGPLYRIIAQALQDDIVQGRVPPGTRLPTHRDLAWDLKVTVGTITRAYQEVERQGLIGGEVGRGTFVRDPRRLAEAPVDAAPPSGLVDLSVNAPALWPDGPSLRAALAAVADRPDLLSAMAYLPQGPLSMRTSLARWIAATGGPEIAPERLLLAPGGQGAMHAAVAAVTRPGDVLLVEQLSYPGIRPLAVQLGLRLVGVAMDDQGVLPDAVEQAARQHGARALYVMPTLHNPTTVTQPRARRETLAALARRSGLVLVEDDVYGFLHQPPAGHALPTLAALAPEQTLYVSSVSKSLFPGLRTGIVAAPPVLQDKVAQVLRATVLAPAHLGLAVTAELIDSGEADRIVARRRALVAERQALARRILGERLYGSSAAATHLWLPLDAPWRCDGFTRTLLEQGIKVTPADAFALARGEVPEAVRVCLCSIDGADCLARALERLATLLGQPAQLDQALI